MRIVQIGGSLFDWGGIERYVAYLAQGLADRGEVVVTLCPPRSPLWTAVQSAKQPLGVRFRLSPLAIARYAQALRGAHVAHVHFSPDFRAAGLGARWAGVPHTVMTRHLAVPWSRRRAALYGRLWSEFISVSDAVRDTLVASGIPAERVRTAYAGTPAPNGSIDRAGERSAWGIGPNEFAVGFFGRLVRDKGVDLAVAAVEQSPKDARLHVFGDGPEREALQKAAGPRTTFHGRVQGVDRPMAAMDAVVVPSRWAEAFPFSTLEAMAGGLPVVAARVGGLPEQVVQGETGLLVSPENPIELAQAIERLAKDRELCRGMGSAARSRWQSEFTVQKFADRVLAVYRDAAQAGTGA